MKKLSFPEKNKLINQLKNDQYFDKDAALFINVCPKSMIQEELKRVNKFRQLSLHTRILSEMLNHISAEEIIANRKEEIAKEAPRPNIVNKIFGTKPQSSGGTNKTPPKKKRKK